MSLLSLIVPSFIIWMLIILWTLWILYVAMMHIERVIEISDIPWQAKMLVLPTLWIFHVVEFVANVIVCTIVFLDLPRERMVTHRLRRYRDNPDKYKAWRLKVVYFIKPMLNPFDHRGDHI